jgi:hypothetical protein
MSQSRVDVPSALGLAPLALVLMLTAFTAVTASAGERPPLLDERTETAHEPELPRFVSFRVAPAPGDGSRKQQLCLDVPLFLGVSVEGCGSGAGFLKAPTEPDLAHFRAKVPLGRAQVRGVTVVPGVVVGFAELQVGEDQAGFDFFGTGRGRTETAGPEVGASLRFLERTTSDPAGPVLVSELQLSLAWLPYAGELRIPHGQWFGSLEWTVGLGW